MCQNFEKICTTSLLNKGKKHIFGSVSDPRAHYLMTHKQYKYYTACSAGAETIVYDYGLLLLAGLV